MTSSKKRLVAMYLAMLLAHQAHVYEEVRGGFFLMGVYGPGLFLLINWLLFCIPAILFYGVLLDKRRAWQLSLIYVGFMAVQGIGHNLLTLISGRYFGGFAGGISGPAMFAIGVPLFLALRRTMPSRA
jgi:hypothetical protein